MIVFQPYRGSCPCGSLLPIMKLLRIWLIWTKQSFFVSRVFKMICRSQSSVVYYQACTVLKNLTTNIALDACWAFCSRNLCFKNSSCHGPLTCLQRTFLNYTEKELVMQMLSDGYISYCGAIMACNTIENSSLYFVSLHCCWDTTSYPSLIFCNLKR